MGNTLNLFPQQAAIGRVDARGNVFMTNEFSRALAALLGRVGGTNGANVDELALDLATQGNAAAWSVAQGLAALEQDFAQALQLTARLAELRKQVEAVEAQLVQVAPPTDWEHPGKIGAAKANSGQFTTVNRVTITAPVGSATLTLANGKTFTVSNTLTLTGTDGSTLNIGTGGTLGTAAYANATSFAARSATALAGAATDAATTQTLANSLRTVLLSVGIGS